MFEASLPESLATHRVCYVCEEILKTRGKPGEYPSGGASMIRDDNGALNNNANDILDDSSVSTFDERDGSEFVNGGGARQSESYTSFSNGSGKESGGGDDEQLSPTGIKRQISI